MPSNLEICLEELDARPDDECYIRCVAVSGGQPGLALDPDGLVRWMPEAEDSCHGLWVSEDGRLMLFGAEAPGALVVERGERSVEAPAGKPVVLIDQDLLRVGGRRLRVHVHGETGEMYEPERLTRSAMQRFFQAAAVAAGLTLGAGALGAGPAASSTGGVIGEPPPIEVRRHPPAPVRRVTFDCSITKQTIKSGKLQVEATCSSTTSLRVGLFGSIIDKKGRSVKKGTVKITSLKGKKIKVEATVLKKAVKDARKVRFWVRP